MSSRIPWLSHTRSGTGHCAWLSHGCWRLNSGPCACAASISPLKHLPRSISLYSCFSVSCPSSQGLEAFGQVSGFWTQISVVLRTNWWIMDFLAESPLLASWPSTLAFFLSFKHWAIHLFAPRMSCSINRIHSVLGFLSDYGKCGSQALAIEHYLLAPTLLESYVSVAYTEPNNPPHPWLTERSSHCVQLYRGPLTTAFLVAILNGRSSGLLCGIIFAQFSGHT